MVKSNMFLMMFCMLYAVSAEAASGFLDTSDQCLAIQRFYRNEVHLKKIGKCDGKPGRVFVEARPGATRVVYVDGLLIGEQQVKSLEVTDVTGVMEKSKAVAKTIKSTGNIHAKEMESVARETQTFYESDEFKKRVQDHTAQIAEQSIGKRFADYYKDSVKKQGGGNLAADEKLYIFVSSSMPLETVRAYASDVAHLKDPRISIVMRGFVKGMHKLAPTVTYVGHALKIDPDCVLTEGNCKVRDIDFMIDPLVFRRYSVDKVPAFVYVKGFKITDVDSSEGCGANVEKGGQHYKVYGDANLKYVLTKLHDATNSQTIQALSEKLP